MHHNRCQITITLYVYMYIIQMYYVCQMLNYFRKYMYMHTTVNRDSEGCDFINDSLITDIILAVSKSILQSVHFACVFCGSWE